MIISPSIWLGRLKTNLRSVLGYPAQRAEIADAWASYALIKDKLALTLAIEPGKPIARLARIVRAARLPSPVRYLEIGSFEGCSLAYLWALLDGKLRATVIDPFAVNPEFPEDRWQNLEERFRKNMAAIGALDSLRILKGFSSEHLPKLVAAGETFDLIYIDGSHRTLDVMLDAVLAWQLLTPGGLMIFDDYRYDAAQLGEGYRVKSAVDAFVAMIGHEIEVLDVSSKVYLRKRALASPS
jgi:predicted O-methyltransferase YrrM